MESQLRRPFLREGDEDVTVIGFAGSSVSLDDETLWSIRDQLFSIAEEPGDEHVLLDFGNVRYVGSTALGTLVKLHANLRAAGRRLTIDNLNPRVHEVFAVTRLDKHLDLRLAAPEASRGRESGGIGRPSGVLVVDDDRAARTALGVALQDRGIEVWSAPGGRQAVELYRTNRDKIAVVLLDVVMPGMDGPHTLLALQKVSSAIRCCFVTEGSNPYTETALLLLGAFCVFRKPFAIAEVIDTLDKLTCRSPRRGVDRWIEFPLQGV